MESTHSKIEKLRDKDSWHQWRFVMRTLLEEDDDLLSVCEGKLTMPTDDKATSYAGDLKKFQKADKAARKLIVTTVERKPLDLLLNCTSAKEMWTKLNAVYDMKSDENLSLIQKQFFEFKWDSSESVAHNLSKLEQLVTKMKSIGSTIENSMLLTRALSVLPAKYNHFHSAWDSMDDTKKTMENLTVRLMSEEMRVEEQKNSDETTVALFTKSKSGTFISKSFNKKTGQNNFKKKWNNSCYNCGKPDHLKKDCPGCYSCGSKSHIQRNCPKKVRNRTYRTEPVRRRNMRRLNMHFLEAAGLLIATTRGYWTQGRPIT